MSQSKGTRARNISAAGVAAVALVTSPGKAMPLGGMEYVSTAASTSAAGMARKAADITDDASGYGIRVQTNGSGFTILPTVKSSKGHRAASQREAVLLSVKGRTVRTTGSHIDAQSALGTRLVVKPSNGRKVNAYVDVLDVDPIHGEVYFTAEKVQGGRRITAAYTFSREDGLVQVAGDIGSERTKNVVSTDLSSLGSRQIPADVAAAASPTLA